jgi:hypothetical protein
MSAHPFMNSMRLDHRTANLPTGALATKPISCRHGERHQVTADIAQR